MSIKFLDKDIYEQAKKIIYSKYKKSYAFRSIALLKKYKALGGRYVNIKQMKNINSYPVHLPIMINEIQPSNLFENVIEIIL